MSYGHRAGPCGKNHKMEPLGWPTEFIPTIPLIRPTSSGEQGGARGDKLLNISSYHRSAQMTQGIMLFFHTWICIGYDVKAA